MSAEHIEPSKVTNLTGYRRSKEGKYNPLELASDDVIAQFLLKAIHYRRNEDSVAFIQRIISRSGEPKDEIEYLTREKLVSMMNQGGDSEDDGVVQMIYDELRSTISNAEEQKDYRRALLDLAQLREAEVSDPSPEESNSTRWENLVRKLGGKSLEQ
ncbi:hypothetical protein H6796_01955 [Candidatus Nomurabacteria bacterium]|nr:hypothetical protein [Candidatus Nomurabacteria bacterium]